MYKKAFPAIVVSLVLGLGFAHGARADEPDCDVGEIAVVVPVSISGSPSAGATLTANPGSYSHCRAQEQPGRLYAWYSQDSSGTNHCRQGCQGNDANTRYVVRSDDVGNHITVQEYVCNDWNCQWFISGPVYTTPPACSNGLDDDGDGLVDMNDPGCASPTDNDEYNPPSAVVNLSASSTTVYKGNTTFLSWSASGASSCSHSASAELWIGPNIADTWVGSGSISGSAYTSPIVGNMSIGMTCTWPGGGTASKTINITAICQGEAPDADSDCVVDSADNCMAQFNPRVEGDAQPDTDGDSKGDACDLPPEWECEFTGTCPDTGADEYAWDNSDQTGGTGNSGVYEITIGNMNTYMYSLSGCPADPSKVADPITILYRSAERGFANAERSLQSAEKVMGWPRRTTGHARDKESPQFFSSWGNCDDYYGDRAQNNLTNPLTSRYHIRCRKTAKFDNVAGLGTTTTCTPHHEDLVIHYTLFRWRWLRCGSILPCGVAPKFCIHAVDKGTPTGSGFMMARNLMVTEYSRAGFQPAYNDWHNTASVRQCDGDYASSDGLVYYITLKAIPTDVTATSFSAKRVNPSVAHHRTD